MTVFIGADHRWFVLKEQLRAWLSEQGYTVVDCGAYEHNPGDDFPEYAHAVATNVAEKEDGKGIVICGSGVGVDIVANKVKGIRAAIGFDETQVKEAREDDDLNVLALASDVISEELAKQLVDIFLNTNYVQSERHERRVEKMETV